MVQVQADHGEQAVFLDGELLLRLEEAKRGKGTVLFVDAAHFVYGPFLGYLWCLANLDTRYKHPMKTLRNLEFQLFAEDVPVLSA